MIAMRNLQAFNYVACVSMFWSLSRANPAVQQH